MTWYISVSTSLAVKISAKPLAEIFKVERKIDLRASSSDARVSLRSIRPHVLTQEAARGQSCCELWAVNIKIIRSSTIFPNKESRQFSWDLLFTLISWKASDELKGTFHVHVLRGRALVMLSPCDVNPATENNTRSVISSLLPLGISCRCCVKRSGEAARSLWSLIYQARIRGLSIMNHFWMKGKQW